MQMAVHPTSAPDASVASGPAPFIRIEGVSKRFGTFQAVENVSLSIAKGEIFGLLGGSGCGKTTLLRMLAGFEEPTTGRIWLDGQDMTGVPPYERPVNMMFQSYALFPHMTVEKNVAYGLKHEAMTDAQRRSRVREMLDLVQLTQFAARKPHQISGGQRQRVALARALARAPKLLLLDEPLAALDKKLREHTQFELMNIQQKTGVTFVVVTHDQEEAMTLSDRIAVMDKGQVKQVGSPTDVYEYPNSRFVAGFIGSITTFDGTVERIAGDIAHVGVPGTWHHGAGPCHSRPVARHVDHPRHPAREDQHHPGPPGWAQRCLGCRARPRILRQGLALPCRAPLRADRLGQLGECSPR